MRPPRPGAGWAAAFALVLLAACADPAPPTTGGVEPVALPAALADRLAAAGLEARGLDREGDAYALAEVDAGGGAVLLQWADLRSVAAEHVLGPKAAAGAAGLYHPTAPSPSFLPLDAAAVVRQAQARGGALAVINGAFFETPGRATTEIAFPIARAGRVVTGGRSPYGPGRPGARDARWGRPLRALALADTVAHVEPYEPATGAPLDRPAFAEAVVSYAPDAHPTRVATRFHVLGPLDADGDGVTETLLVATSDGATTIDVPAALLARLGVEPARQVALDGGASVFVWNRRAGVLHRPAPAGGRDPQRLPHYVTLRLRTPDGRPAP